MIKKLLLYTFICTAIRVGIPANAQLPAPATARVEEPLQIIVDLGPGQRKVRESHHGVVDPVAIPVGQQVIITLRFLPTFAGTPALVSPLDGGELTPPQDPTIARDGTFAFQFRPGKLPGSYRLLVNGVRQYEVSIYTYDPNNPSRRGPSH
jgi:hypothetical protein